MLDQVGKPTLWHDLLFTFYWFSKNVENTALSVVLLAKIVLMIVGPSQSGSWLAYISAAAALVGALAYPIMGHWSDRSKSRFGRRRPFMVVGIFVSFLFLFGTLFFREIIWLTIFFLILQVVHAMASIPYEGLLSDYVAPERSGFVTGLLGMMSQFANLAGVILASLLTLPQVYIALILLQLLGLLTTLVTVRQEKALTRESHTQRAPHALRHFFSGLLISPRENPNWWWVFASRVAAMTGFAVVYTYLYYYLEFVEHLSNPGSAIDVDLVATTIGAVVANVIAGAVSDRVHNRKWVTFAGSMVMAASALAFALVASLGLYVIYVMSFFYGIGYGMYQGTERALLLDVQPNKEAAAKSFGLWQMSYNIGIMFGTLYAGIMLSSVFHHLSLMNAYRGLYGSTFVFFLVGGITLFGVRSRKNIASTAILELEASSAESSS